ncbi:MAG: hypothetical protein QM638_12225 [Nocardioides sp.]|uniref:hypothetical protein n=1 Tax=Nocardioides sp. TaxID=35761 RepID=UPI0039E6AD76
MKTERLQVLIEAGQRERLEQLAGAKGRSVAALVRDAIDLAYPAVDGSRRRSAALILSAEPMDVPDEKTLRTELDEIRARHA